MDNKYFKIDDTLFDITEKYEEAIEALVSIGFTNIKDNNQRKNFGKSITLKTALTMKKVDIESFVEQLVEKISSNNNKADLNIQGVLPCPVRVPLMEAFENWLKENQLESRIEYDLKAASMGVDWLLESIESSDSADVLADIFISAGFDLFFDKNLIGKYKSEKVFEDITQINHYNSDFENEEIILKDPDNEYSMIGVVPAIFLINTDELGESEMPSSWEDLLSGEFENKVSLPVGDFDLFNAILLTIHANYGDEGVKKLGKSLLKSMHPSEMVKSHIRKTEKPIVTIMPYFFTKTVREGGPMVAVWPKDGAIISPIFMLSKKDKKEELKPIVDFFASKEVGEILSHNGRFPSVNPNVDNMIPSDNKYMWLGWDNIKKTDIGKMIKRCENLFNQTIKEVEK